MGHPTRGTQSRHAIGLVVILAAAPASGGQQPPAMPTPDSDPAVQLCHHLTREMIRTRSTFQRETVSYGSDGVRPFVEIGFTALALNEYMMFGRARCRFDVAAATDCAETLSPNCATYTFYSLMLDDEEIVHPQAVPGIRGSDTMLGR